MNVISTISLCKSFGKTQATQDISIHVDEGEIYGFIGLNGAGKTTLIRMLLGMIRPGSGKVKLFQEEVTTAFALWNDVGYLVETPHAYGNLSVLENLRVYYSLRRLTEQSLISNIIDKLKLTSYRNRKAKDLSLGNLQRLGLAKALMHRPKLVILDEPINGLDPGGIIEVRDLLRELAASGSTIFLSSHILGEVSKIATRIGIIHKGKLVKELAAEELTNQLEKKLVLSTLDNGRALQTLRKLNFGMRQNADADIEVYDEKAIRHPESIAKFLVEEALPPTRLYTHIEDLEQYFLRTITKT